MILGGEQCTGYVIFKKRHLAKSFDDYSCGNIFNVQFTETIDINTCSIKMRQLINVLTMFHLIIHSEWKWFKIKNEFSSHKMTLNVVRCARRTLPTISHLSCIYIAIQHRFIFTYTLTFFSFNERREEIEVFLLFLIYGWMYPLCPSPPSDYECSI